MISFLSRHGLSLLENEHEQIFRSIISNKKFIAKSTIIRSHPLTAFPISTYNKIRCNQCLKKREKLQTCSKCQKVYYCDRSCQRSSWISHHKLLCSLYTKSKSSNFIKDNNNNNDYYYDEEMLRRISILTEKFFINREEQSSENYDDNYYLFETFLNLMTHRNDQTSMNLKNFEKISNNVHEILNCNKITKNDLINYLCIFYCNNFTIHDNQLFVYGEGTFPIGSLFNHSCRPNAIVMYDGAVQIIKCIENINIGEEINISYIDLALDRSSRQEMLQKKYFFKCQCPRCFDEEQHSGIFSKIDQLIEEKDQGITRQEFNTALKNWISSPMSEQKESKFSKVTTLILSKLLPHLKNDTIKDDYLHSLSEIISNLLEQNHLTTTTTNLFYTSSLSFTTKLFYDKIDLEQWNQSTILGRYILSIYLLIYPRYHPIIGLHLFTLGKCYWNDTTNGLESIQESIDFLECAQKVLNITHNEGDENIDVINQVNDLLNKAKKEKFFNNQ